MHGPLALPLSLLLVVPLFLSSANAHGIVQSITINGRYHAGNQPNQGFRAPGPSVIRQVQDTNPVKGSYNPAIICGTNAGRATQVAEAYPGEEVLFNWGTWPHNTGPIITYMASCGQTGCDQFNAANARWFKIAQVGKKQGSYDWHQNDLRSGAPGRAVIPRNLAPGNYLIRHEIIALHLASTVGGAEFYPSCSQLRVGGQGTGYPAENELVSFPGAYYDEHPGLVVPGVFEVGFQYQFPGPAIAQLGGSGPAPAPAPQQPSPTTQQAKPTPKPEEPYIPPINAAPIPSASPSPSPVKNAPISPAPPASTPTAPRRCKKRNSKRSIKFVTVKAEAEQAQPTPHYVEPIAISKRGVEVVDVPAPAGIAVAKRHHSRVMKRLAAAHSH
ncbi:hypothetical protein FA15DRAFT_411262 [Coprinopsis marcescibilis]|uniref:lytic cellulose monooxygenase (C4-dehydrogenating) n=1 Tax=Coprinopsis marcescibilis TaxID=230819 RepID=A0A5C3KXJ1_COPMA|nr:hypothetical protein FA15DRAFT_411262 [Coprinopsis marcescibilis]